MRVLFSKPLTFRSQHPLPAGFVQIMDEGVRLYELGKAGSRKPDLMLQAELFWTLLRQRRSADAIVTGRYGDLFAIFQGLFPVGRRPFFLMDTEWPNRRTGWKRRVSVMLHRLMARGATRIQVFCECEAAAYEAYFGIDRNVFAWIPYCTDDREHAFEVAEEPYLFTGGLHHRDYLTLRDAVKDLPIEVRIAAPAGSIPAAHLAPNMTVMGRMERDDYFRMMAKATLVVLSLERGVMRSPGVITYVYAMRMGKCVIVNEPDGAPSYMENGRTGAIVPPEDPAALRAAIVALLDDHERRRSIGNAARAASREELTIGRYVSDLQAIVADIVASRGRHAGGVLSGVPENGRER
jgi:glycosyltransferase involved in cell wall biosynthesis